MALIRIVSSTMGQSTPASVAEGTGWYRFKRDPEWTPGDARYRQEVTRGHGPGPGHRNSSENKAERFRRFCSLRDEDVPVAEAGKQVGVAPKTARTYEQQRKEQQRGEGPQP